MSTNSGRCHTSGHLTRKSCGMDGDMLQNELLQKQTVTQQMVQTASILQMTTQELEQYLQEQALENPVMEMEEASQPDLPQQTELQRKIDWLEETDYQNRSYYQEERRAAGSDGEIWDRKQEKGMTLAEYLHQQVAPGVYSSQERRILGYLAESLDNRGYFTDGIQTAATILHVSEAKVAEMLKVIQGMEPTGVGAENLQECLLLQLRSRQEDTALAEKLVESYLAEIAKNHLPVIAKALHVSVDQVQVACRQIRSLHPKPGSGFLDGEAASYIRPDIYVMEEQGDEGRFRIIVREGTGASFQISDYYRQLARETQDIQARQYLKEKLSQASSLARDIETRKITLYRVAGAIVNHQSAFFSGESPHRQPLRLADLAEDLQLHESTVSRAMKGKYLQCSRGLFPLKYFLTGTRAAGRKPEVQSPQVQTSQALTPEEVKERIQKLVEEEDKKKPLSDGEIQKRLEEEQIHLARRTVNKYRKELGIPDKAGRKAW